MLLLGTLNVRGITNLTSKKALVNDIGRNNILCCAIQETHIKESGVISFICDQTKVVYNLHTISSENVRRGIGFVVKSDVDCNIEKISDRLAVIYIHLKDHIGKVRTIRVFNVYAPPRSKSKAYKEEIGQLFDQLETNINKGSVYKTFICGDFNLSVGSAHDQYPSNIGSYGKGIATEQSDILLGLLQRNNLYVTNTFFKHKLAHVTTWQSEYIKENRRNPYRTQIDFVIAHSSWKRTHRDARSYINLDVSTDHRLVISKFNVDWSRVFAPKKPNKNISVEHLSNTSIKDAYCDKVKTSITNHPADQRITWQYLCDTCIKASEDLKPKRKTGRVSNDDVAILSEHQKNLYILIKNCQDQQKKRILRTCRNKALHDIRRAVKRQENLEVLDQIKEIENSKHDSRRMFKATQVLRRKTDNSVCVKDKNGLVVNSESQKIERISEYFESVFNPVDVEEFPVVPPKPLQHPFTSDEIGKAISSLKNNKSAGIDKLRAEHLKCAPPEINQCIADILNNTCETGDYPEQISIGLLTPLQKPGKPKGPPQNLRPVILLSILRKIIAICTVRRISDRLFGKVIPITQAAYRPGRSATELVFAFKLLAEKAIISENYDIHLLLLDMSKAFDTIKRDILINDLKEILEDDELHLVSLLLKNIRIGIKLNNRIGKLFNSVIGSPQGDGASAIFFIAYLAKSKKQEDLYGFKEKEVLAIINGTRVKVCCREPAFLLEQQFADDISFASTSTSEIDRIQKETSSDLAKRNLQINDSKTERYSIERGGNTDWKKCKLVGSLLSTEEDIKRRKILANSAFCQLKAAFFTKHITLDVKLRLFKALVESVFLYNSEIWGLTTTQENNIDVFQRKFLRSLLQIRYSAGNWCSNEDLYRISGQVPWSRVIRSRRWRFFGHVCRLNPATPARRALQEITIPTKRPRGRTCTTYISTIRKDLQSKGIANINQGVVVAQDRVVWRSMS